MQAADMDDDRVAHRRAEHHQPHDRSPADAIAVLLDLDHGVDLAGEIDELGAGPGVEPALVGDLDLAADRVQAAASPRISEATEIYLRPASRAAATAAWTGITLRAPSRRISIGRFTPAITSMFSLFIRLIARLDGVPPNRSVRMITPWPCSTRAIASAMSLRRPSMSSSGPMQIASIASCGPTTCSMAVTNSAASRPWVTSTSPIIRSTRLSQHCAADRPRSCRSAGRRDRDGVHSEQIRIVATALPSRLPRRPSGAVLLYIRTQRSRNFFQRPSSGESNR